MKKGVLLFYLFVTSSIFSQVYIEGKVTTSNNEALEGASVYLNNTTIGTTTNSNGEFRLNVKKGHFDLVISFIGYATSKTKINTNEKIKYLSIQLTIEENILNEVVLRKPKYDEEWKTNLTIFKRAFLGKTKLAKDCKILNPKTLFFEFNRKTGELIAEVKEPLKIKHNALGYMITYDLVEFSLQRNRLFFSGFARYSNLKKSVRKKWKRNRLEAYNGSQMHFFRSLVNNKLKDNGFIVNQFRRELNPDRPSEKKIKLAREFISLQNNTINFSKNITIPKTQLDSAIVIINNSRKPKYIDYLYKKNISRKEMLSFKNDTPYLDFNDYLTILYTKEPEDENYLIGMFGKRKKSIGMQSSNIVLINGKSMIDRSGTLVNPKALFVEDYWGFESFANMLPLDYQPGK